MRGGSAFKVTREDSNEQKKYDETGLVVSSCKHCVVPYAINIFKGESRTWTHTALMHNEAMKSIAKFFCYDRIAGPVCRTSGMPILEMDENKSSWSFS
jgi:hypothetical protein